MLTAKEFDLQPNELMDRYEMLMGCAAPKSRRGWESQYLCAQSLYGDFIEARIHVPDDLPKYVMAAKMEAADYFSVCDDEDGVERSRHDDYESAFQAVRAASTAIGHDFYIEPMFGKRPIEYTSRLADEDAHERTMEAVRLSDLARTATKPDQFNFVLGFARDLARDYLYAGDPIPKSVADAALKARKALGLAA